MRRESNIFTEILPRPRNFPWSRESRRAWYFKTRSYKKHSRPLGSALDSVVGIKTRLGDRKNNFIIIFSSIDVLFLTCLDDSEKVHDSPSPFATPIERGRASWQARNDKVRRRRNWTLCHSLGRAAERRRLYWNAHEGAHRVGSRVAWTTLVRNIKRCPPSPSLVLHRVVFSSANCLVHSTYVQALAYWGRCMTTACELYRRGIVPAHAP